MYPFPVQYCIEQSLHLCQRGNINSVIDDFNADVVILRTQILLDKSHNVGESMSSHPIHLMLPIIRRYEFRSTPNS